MKLFTKEIEKKLFQQYPYGNDLDSQKVVAKIFNPYGRGTWYLLNSDPDDPDYLWAIVDLFEVEVGSVSRSELESIKVKPFGLGLERDLYFTPVNASELLQGLLSGKRYAEGGISDVEVIEKNNEAYLSMPQLGKGSTMVKLEHGGNLDMLKNQAVQFKHHAEELHNVLKSNPDVHAWVVAKAERASTDLSDITHYLEGSEKMAKGGQLSIFEQGGNILSEDTVARVDDPAFADLSMYKFGGVTYTEPNKRYYFQRYNDAIGAFSWKFEGGKIFEGTLYALDEFDLDYYKKIELKDGEALFRYVTDRIRSVEPKSKYLIKINLDKGLIYFISDSDENKHDDKNPKFQTKGIKAEYIVLDRSQYLKIYENKSVFEDGGEVFVGLGQPVTYRGELYEVTQKNGVTHLTLNKEGAWGSDYPSIPLSMINQNELRNIYGEKVFIPYTFDKGGQIKNGSLVRVKKYGWIMRVDKIEGNMYYLENDRRGTMNGNAGSYLASDIELVMAKGGKITEDKNYAKGRALEDLKWKARVKKFSYKPYGKIKGRFTVSYFADGQEQKEIAETKEMAIDTAKRYTKLFPIVIITDENGNQVKFAKGGGVGKFKVGDIVYNKRHKTIGIVRDIFEEYGDLKTDADGVVSINELEIYNKHNTEHQSAHIAPSTKKELGNKYAKGGVVYLSERQKDTLYNSWVNSKNKLVDLTEDLKKAKSRNDKYDIIEINKSIKRTKLYVSSLEKMMNENDIEYAKGGKTTFKDKVASIKSKLLKNKKVPKAVQKDYGKTFSPAEAEDSAKRIAGAMRKKEMAKK